MRGKSCICGTHAPMIPMNIIVAVPLGSSLAEFIGKRSSENSISFYNRKERGNVIVALAPSSIDEKFYALPQTLLMADQVLLSTAELDRAFGEVLVACSLLGKRVIFTRDNDVSEMAKSLGLEVKELASREELLDMILSKGSLADANAPVRVDLDKAFNVKGVGTVALGIVTRGTLKVHDQLLHSSGKQVVVRSIQSQDEDIKEAPPGTRVGLALKGIDESDMSKGDILSPVQVPAASLISLELRQSGFAKELIEKGKMYQIAVGFSFSNATVEEINGSSVSFRLEKGIPVEKGDAALLARAVQPRIFAYGTVTSITKK